MSQETSKNMNDLRIAFGARLKSAREAMHQETKDVAAQLRLNERIILMLESGQYDDELPLTFLKGYIRSYGKLLQLSDDEIKQVLEPLQPVVKHLDPALLPPAAGDITSRNYRMQLASAIIGLTVVGLVGTWWHNHTTSSSAPLLTAIPVPTAPTVAINPPLAAPTAPTQPTMTLPTPNPADHPLANAMAQQIAPNGAPTANTNAAPVKPADDAKPIAPAHKAAPSKQSDDDADDDNNDNDQTD
jgi:cytoskeleton protein RodZ